MRVRMRSGAVVDVDRLIDQNKRLMRDNERLRYRGDAPMLSEDGLFFCGMCGAEVEDIDNYCPSCGVRFED